MAIRVTFECGHASMLRVRTTPQGYTHDWEVFVRGLDNADISQYVDKVVFHLHETFPKPKRILKEPPYLVKESGYAGFVIPIDVYLRNKDEPKRIQISYDLILQPSGPAFNNVIRHNEVFANPSEEFRKKLLKGGGISVSGGTEESGGDKGDYKMVPPMVSKPKLSGSDGTRKHRTTDLRSSNSFADLFGNPMTLPAKVSPETKRVQSSTDKLSLGGTGASASSAAAAKTSPLEKTEKSEKPTKPKHSPHKDKRKERSGEDRKDRRDKTVVKDKDRVKEKPKRPTSPTKDEPVKRPPTVTPPAPAATTTTTTTTTTPTTTTPTTTTTTTPGSPSKKTLNLQESPKSKERDHKKLHADREKPKDAFKVPIEDRKFDRKKKKHKDERSKERSKDERPKDPTKKADKKLPKPEKTDKILIPTIKEERKSPKHQKERVDKRGDKNSDDVKHTKDTRAGSERDKQRHKHKRKDRKERVDDSNLDKEAKKLPSDKKYGASSPSSNLAAERDSDSAHSLDEETTKNFSKNDGPESIEAKIASPSRLTAETKVDEERTKRSDAKKIVRSEERDSRKRKRKLVDGNDEQQSTKRPKERSASPSVEPVSSSQSPISSDLDSRFYKDNPSNNQPAAPASQTAVTNDNAGGQQIESEQVAPDSTNNALVEPDNDPARSVFSDDYVTQLKELQQKIMTLQDNQELQRVVQVIAETGQYEITKKTFDFDLCALDRRTVLRLQQFFSTS